MAASAPTSRTTQYRVSVFLILLCGIIAAVWMYRESRSAETEHAVVDFERRATAAHAFTREVLQRYTEGMYGLSTVFALNNDLTHEEFVRATSQVLPRLSGALAFEWAPYVGRDQRAATEAAMQRTYAPQRFDFIEFDAEGRIHRATDRPYYYPVCYIEPLRGNEIILGYDLVGAPTRPYLERARLSHELVTSPQFRLRQETGNQLGLVIVLPVFPSSDERTRSKDASAGPNLPIGYLQCVFHVHELLRQASPADRDPVLEVLFVDNSEADVAKRVLYFQAASRPSSVPDETSFRAEAPFLSEAHLPIGGRDWLVMYRPRASWLQSQYTTAPVWRAVTLLSLSALLAGFVHVIGRRTEVIQREVKLRTAELAESRRQFENLVHALPGMAYQARYGASLDILFASEGATELTGWSPEAFMTGQVHVRELIHPHDLDRVRNETRAALAAHKDVEAIYRLRTKSGDDKWVLSRGRGVYDANGKLTMFEGIVIDISDQKRAEEERIALERKLLETQKLESLGLLAGGIAHDFNNLLSAILGNASLARMTLESGSAADPQLKAIENASLRAAELCRQMLAYAGKGRFVVERVDLSSMVEDLLPLLRVSIARSAALNLDLTRELPGVKADATQLRQIVMNLVLNAVDALAGRSGDITIRTGVAALDQETLARCVTGQGLPLGPYAFLEVADTGSGMTPEVMSKIFDPFFTTKFAGRGLGLAAVLGIVRGHNGALLVESEVDRGSKFRLYLPPIMGELVKPEPPPADSLATWRQTGDVLVIDDEEPVQEVMAQLLKTFGFTVRVASDGRSGLDVFRENPDGWSLVVLDLLMPGMSGEQTLVALQAIRPDIRVLLVSGYSEGDILHRVKPGGRTAFLAKPFRRETFGAKLRELFS